MMDCSAMVVSGLARGQKPSFKRIKLGCAINVIKKRSNKSFCEGSVTQEYFLDARLEVTVM